MVRFIVFRCLTKLTVLIYCFWSTHWLWMSNNDLNTTQLLMILFYRGDKTSFKKQRIYICLWSKPVTSKYIHIWKCTFLGVYPILRPFDPNNTRCFSPKNTKIPQWFDSSLLFFQFHSISIKKLQRKWTNCYCLQTSFKSKRV